MESTAMETARATAKADPSELLKVMTDSDTPTVSGRDLHEFLQVATQYKDWFPRMCEYGFTEGIDYSSFLSDRSDGLPGKPRTDHQLTITMAKELCMLQRTERGKQARQYFLEIERRWNTPEAVMARALQMAKASLAKLQGEHLRLQAENSELVVRAEVYRPKAEYFDEMVDRNLLTSFRETAKQLGVKEREFIGFLMQHKYLYRDKKGKLMPYAEKNDGLFELKECLNSKTQWAGTQTLVTPRGRETFKLLLLGAPARLPQTSNKNTKEGNYASYSGE